MISQSHLAALVSALTLGAAACTPTAPLHPTGSMRDTTAPPVPRRAATAADPRQIETICDRMEDCAVERNVSLARRYSTNPEDIKAARAEARQALIMGAVRRWCIMRVGRIPARQVRRIHQCLKHTACTPFFTCADFPASEAREPFSKRAHRAR